MKKLIFLLINIPFLINAQEQRGIKYEQLLSWPEIFAKAKVENKYVFVDAYATWCGPCKLMDEEVYPSEKVGEYVNKKYISVKVQMDSTKKDNERVKKWYADASKIFKKYKLTVFPTYLFFSPEGKLVHKAIGAMPVPEFLELVRAASDPNTQYYTLVEKYKHNEVVDSAKLYDLAILARKNGDKDFAYNVAVKYKKMFLDKLTIEDVRFEHLSFLSQFSEILIKEGSKGIFFKMFYEYPEKLDSITFGRQNTIKSFTGFWLDFIITREEIDKKIWRSNNKLITENPDWQNIHRSIQEKFSNRNADSLVLEGKMSFYRKLEKWHQYAMEVDEKLIKYPPQPGDGITDDPWILNHLAWDIFKYCTDKTVLTKALRWIDISLKLAGVNPNPQCLDTKASLLYKLGKAKEAIMWEEKAIRQLEVNIKKTGGDPSRYTKEYIDVVKKMHKGEPIYLSEGAIWLTK